MKRVLVILIACAVGLLALFPLTGQTQGRAQNKLRKVRGAIANQYIVVLKDDTPGHDVPSVAAALANAHGGVSRYSYQNAIKGFAVQLPEAAAIALSRDPRVEYVEEDGVVSIIGTQTNAPWGLDRIDQRDRPLNGTYNYTHAGDWVYVYVLDSGIRTTHQEFGGRASVGYDAFGGNGQDANGHGTAVAGIIGGSTYGVAKNSRLISIRVCDSNGLCPTSSVIAGVDWVTAHHYNPAVANMSLGGPASSALDYAVSNSIASNVTYVIAAGNDGVDAINTSPARVGQAITVGATDDTDTRATFTPTTSSNYGGILDLFAPGKLIPTTTFNSDTSMDFFSGTSFAAPHVAGVAAQYRSNGKWYISPSETRDIIVSNATSGRITNQGPGSPNLLLYSGFDMNQCPASYCTGANKGCEASYCRAVGYRWENCQCKPPYPYY